MVVCRKLNQNLLKKKKSKFISFCKILKKKKAIVKRNDIMYADSKIKTKFLSLTEFETIITPFFTTANDQSIGF